MVPEILSRENVVAVATVMRGFKFNKLSVVPEASVIIVLKVVVPLPEIAILVLVEVAVPPVTI